MTDTSPEIVAAVRDRIMKFSGAERFIMGTRMFESARAVMLASLPKDISESERKRILFERLYGDLASLDKAAAELDTGKGIPIERVRRNVRASPVSS